MARRLIIVGRGKFAVDCLKIIRRLAPDCLLCVLAESETAPLGMTLPRFCEREKIECYEFERLNSETNLNLARAFGPDLGFSLNNFQIIKSSLLEIPQEGFINFHNGPLPRYGGVNVCSWAILNGESEYGVTWHFIDKGVDTGDIIAQRLFPIPGDATALSLTMTCFKTGLQIFKELLPVFAQGPIPRQAQSREGRSYFSRRDLPNEGHIDFNWSSERINRFVRGLSFKPLANPFVYPQFTHENLTFNVLSVDTETGADKTTVAPGTIVDISNESISVSCGDGLIVLRELLDPQCKAISLAQFVAEYRVFVGCIFK